MKGQKKETWRIVVATISFIFILYMWREKDVLEIYRNMPAEQVLPHIVITIVVSLVKVGVFTVGILVIKWIVSKLKK